MGKLALNNHRATSIVIFGASGDLTKRKLMPSLYILFKQNRLPEKISVIGVGRTEYSDSNYRDYIRGELKLYLKDKDYDQSSIDGFLTNLYYVTADPSKVEDYEFLKQKINVCGSGDFSNDNLLYYVATPPKLYESIPENLGRSHLSSEEGSKGVFRRIIVEKPFGYDLESSLRLNKQLKKYFTESQIYRIDHFLGKETVQNILALRFSNGIFEPLWNRNYIERVEITAVENLGIEQRGGYYENAGALRDMVQNHLIQLVALCAMEPPVEFNEKDFRDEVAKLYKSIKPLSVDEIRQNVVRGQYTSSIRGGEQIKGYREEYGVNTSSTTETFVAMKLGISNWRWSGVPFYIRTGKQMPTKVSEIVIHFRKTPHHLFSSGQETPPANQLIIRLQPNEGIVLKFGMKVPGSGFEVKQVPMDFTYDKLGGLPTEDAYSRLIEDCLDGDSTLFTRSDAVEAAWRLFDPVLKYWNDCGHKVPLYGYPAGTWGPLESEKIIENGHNWTNPCKNLTNTDLYCEL